MSNKIHEGRNVKRFRELLGMKQEALAAELGEDWNQKKISLLEQKEIIEPNILQQVAGVLRVPEAVLHNFDEETVLNVFSFSYTETNISDCEGEAWAPASNVYNPTYDFHAEEKVLEEMKNMVEEIRRLNDLVIKEKEEKAALYERLLQELQNRK